MKKWKCTICGTIVEGDVPPEKCPVCKVPGEKFVEVTEEADWATEHEVGALKDVPADIIEGLRSNFTGECSEVGMYLAMARVAFREGYPEIGLYWAIPRSGCTGRKPRMRKPNTPRNSPNCWARS